MKIGELAAKTGTAVETIRYYERAGLLPDAARTEGNYRIYDGGHAARLAFIRHCRMLDMTLDEVRILLRFKDRPRENCGEVNALLDEHIGHVSERIRELRALERQLKALRTLCSVEKDAENCGILNELGHMPQAFPPETRHAAVHVAGTHGRRRTRVHRK